MHDKIAYSHDTITDIWCQVSTDGVDYGIKMVAIPLITM